MGARQDMKRTTIIPLSVLAVLIFAAFARYGTLSPCGALKQQMKASLLQQFVVDDSTSAFEKAGSAIGFALAGPMIDSLVGGLSPMQCARGLIKLETGGSPFDGESLLDRATGSSDLQSLGSQKSERYFDKWTLSTGVSPIDDSPSVYLQVDANEKVKGWINDDVRPSLGLRCEENQTNAYINLKTRPDVDYGSYGGKSVRLRLRFDKTPAYSEKFVLSTDGEAVFFRDPIATIKKMMNHEELLIEFLPSGGSPQTTAFNIRGLTKEIGPLQKACHW